VLINSNASTCPTAASLSDPAPCGIPLNIVLDPAAATAFVLNQGTPCTLNGNQCMSGSSPITPTIYSFSVTSDGSLSAPGAAVTLGCGGFSGPCNDTATAMVRDAAGQFVFEISLGSSPPPADCPHPPSSTTDVCPSISVFAMTPSSTPGGTTLTLAGGSPMYLSKVPSALSPVTFTPAGSSSAQELLFVTNNLDICTQNCIPPSPHNDNTVSVYSVSSSGALTEQPNSPYSIPAVNPVSVLAVNTSNPAVQNGGGLFVYVGNQGSSTGAVTPFQLCTIQNAVCNTQQAANNLLVPVTGCTVSCAESAGQKPVQMVVDPTNNFLYVLSELSGQLFGFVINTTAGKLTPQRNAYEPTGAQPVSMALHPSVNNTGQYLYVSNSGSSSISGFNLDTTAGTMSGPFSVVAPAAPSGMAVH